MDAAPAEKTAPVRGAAGEAEDDNTIKRMH